MKRTYSNIVQGNIEVGETTVKTLNGNRTAPSRAIKVEVSEMLEREKRKLNLVIYGIEETNSEEATKEKVNDIVKVVGLDVSKIKYFGRVGRQVEGSRPRIVRVVCEDAESKRDLLKAANRLKGVEGFGSIYVGLDMTKTQQVQDKNLRDKLKDIRAVHKDAKINNGEIVVFEEGHRKILFSLQN